jgi:hypothetical protein
MFVSIILMLCILFLPPLP